MWLGTISSGSLAWHLIHYSSMEKDIAQPICCVACGSLELCSCFVNYSKKCPLFPLVPYAMHMSRQFCFTYGDPYMNSLTNGEFLLVSSQYVESWSMDISYNALTYKVNVHDSQSSNGRFARICDDRIDCTRAAFHFSEPCSSSPASGTHIMFCMNRCASMTNILGLMRSNSCIGLKARPDRELSHDSDVRGSR